MVKKHAAKNIKRYLTAKTTNKAAAMRFATAIAIAMRVKTGSTAIVLPIKPIGNDFRDNWELNDRLVAIIRGGNAVTVMLSRQGQINQVHLRTDSIVRV